MIDPPRWVIMCGSTAFADRKVPGEVDVLHALPLGDRNEVHRPTARDPGRGHENVDGAVATHGVVHDLLLLVGISYIERVELGRLGRLLDRGPFVGRVDVRTDDDGAFGREALGARVADPRRRTRDVRDFAFETTHLIPPSSVQDRCKIRRDRAEIGCRSRGSTDAVGVGSS